MHNDTETVIYGVDELSVAAQKLATHLDHCKIMTFQGVLGAGKTTIIQTLLRQCGIKGEITSPTFTYLNIYENNIGQKFYHFDLYRIATLHDFMSAGFYEYLYQQNSWALIEWPSIIMSLLTHDLCQVSIEYYEDLNKRVMQIDCHQ
jgi:tRNA threonylcarbamoyladenosine biosynthesis protein TsaE